MAKGHRSQIKRARNEQKDTRPSATLSYARVSVQKACFVLDAIRGKDVATSLGIVTYNPRYASSLIKKLLEPYGIKTVPIVEEGKTLPETIAELVEYSKGKSVVRKEQKREGVVMRNVQSNISFKVINPDFLLAEKD